MSNEGLRIRIDELADTRWNTLREYRRVGTMFPEPFDALNRILDVIEGSAQSDLADEIIAVMVEELKPWPAVLKQKPDSVTSSSENESRATRCFDRDRCVWEFEAESNTWHQPPFDTRLSLNLLRAQHGPLIELKNGEFPEDVRL